MTLASTTEPVPQDRDWFEYPLRNRYINARKLVAHLDDELDCYKLSTQQDFFIIRTPKPLNEAQKQAIQEASKLKMTSPTNRLPIPIRGQRRRSPTPLGERERGPRLDTTGHPEPPQRSATTDTSASRKRVSALKRLGIFSRAFVTMKNVGQSNKTTISTERDPTKASSAHP